MKRVHQLLWGEVAISSRQRIRRSDHFLTPKNSHHKFRPQNT